MVEERVELYYGDNSIIIKFWITNFIKSSNLFVVFYPTKEADG